MHYTLRNGDVVAVDLGYSDETAMAIWHNGVIKYLLKPDTPEAMVVYPVGGVLGNDFDVIAVHTEHFNPLSEGALIHNSTHQGEIDLMSSKDAFSTIEYYHGTPVANLSDDQIFGYVRNIDAKLKDIAGLGDGKAVTAHTVRLEAEKTGLLRVVDARYEADSE